MKYILTIFLSLLLIPFAHAGPFHDGNVEIENNFVIHDTPAEEPLFCAKSGSHRIGINEANPTSLLDVGGGTLIGSMDGIDDVIVAGDYGVNGNSFFDGDTLTTTSAKHFLRDSTIGTYSQANTFMDLFADGAVRIGDSVAGAPTNYANFAPDGELTLVGTARVLRSIDFEPEAVKQGGVGPGASTEDGFPIHDYSATNDESVFIHWEIPHDYASAGKIHLHAEYFVDTAPASEEFITWGVEYKKQSIGDNFDFGSGTTTIIVNDALTSGTPANDKQIHDGGEIQLITTDFEPMDIILIRFFRDANASENGATDNFGSDARLFNYHLMYLIDKMGQAY